MLFAILQAGNVEAILEVLPELQKLRTYYPPASEVARGVQTIHLQVRDRIRASRAMVEQQLDHTNSQEKEKVSHFYERILSLYP